MPALLIPALQNRFLVTVEATSAEFQSSIVAFGMDFVKKNLLLMVEQTLTAQVREHIVIQDMIDNPKRRITLELLDDQLAIVDTIKFNSCIVIDHQVLLNYASTNSILHDVILSYDSMILGNGSGQNAYNAAMSIIGKP